MDLAMQLVEGRQRAFIANHFWSSIPGLWDNRQRISEYKILTGGLSDPGCLEAKPLSTAYKVIWPPP